MRPITYEASVRWGLGSYTLRLERSAHQAPAAAPPGAAQQLEMLLQLIACNSRFAAEVAGLLQLACGVTQGPALARDLWRTSLQQLLGSGRLRLFFSAAMPCAPSAGSGRAVKSRDELPPTPLARSDEADATTVVRLFYGIDCKLYAGDVALWAMGATKTTSGDTARRHDGFIDEAHCRPRDITHWRLTEFIQAAEQRRLADFAFERP